MQRRKPRYVDTLNEPSDEVYKPAVSPPAVSPSPVIVQSNPYTPSSSISPQKPSTAYFGHQRSQTISHRRPSFNNDVGRDGNGFSVPQKIPKEVFLLHFGYFKAGLHDSVQFSRVVRMVLNDTHLQAALVKSLLINAICTSTLIFINVVVLPMLGGRWTVFDDELYQLVFFAVFFVNSQLSGAVSKRAAMDVSGPSRNQVPNYTLEAAKKVFCILDSFIVGWLLNKIPILGYILSVSYFGLINSYWVSQTHWTTRGWPMAEQIHFIETHSAYFFGFGFLLSFISSLGGMALNTALYTISFPVYTILSPTSRPVPEDESSDLLASEGGNIGQPAQGNTKIPIMFPLAKLLAAVADSIDEYIEGRERARNRNGFGARKFH